MTLDISGPRGATVSPRVALLSIVCFWLTYFAIATVRWMLIGGEHQADMLAARALVAVGSMLATYIVYLAMRPLAGRSLAINVTAVALLAIPAAVAYSSINWIAMRQVTDKMYAAKSEEYRQKQAVIDNQAADAARAQAKAALAAAREAIRRATEQAREATEAQRAAIRQAESARRAAEKAQNDAAAARRDAQKARTQTDRDDAEASEREGWEEYQRGMAEARAAVAEARRHGIKIDLDELMGGIPVPPRPGSMKAAAPAAPAAPVAPVAAPTPAPRAAPLPPVTPIEIPSISVGDPAPRVIVRAGAAMPVHEEDDGKSVFEQIADQALNGYFFFGAWGALFLALSYAAAVRAVERESAGYRAAARDAELRALRYQVNPHFLFNTLNSLSTLVLKERPEEAERMILNLSTFFRTSLTADPKEDVRLSEEIRLQRLYLDIEAVRFPERMKVDISIPPSLSNACVPCLILQPLVENAIKYGVSRSKRPVHIFIGAREDSHGLVLTVEDDGDAMDDDGKLKGTGVGLKNVTDRLKARFGDDAACRYGLLPNGGFGVTLFMPLIRNGA